MRVPTFRLRQEVARSGAAPLLSNLRTALYLRMPGSCQRQGTTVPHSTSRLV